jgi:hypothetical protein
VQASSTQNCFCASSSICAEHVILEGLRVARVDNIVIFCYGMKCPVGTYTKFDHIMIRRQIDISTNIAASAIPLFVTYAGTTFEMIFKGECRTSEQRGTQGHCMHIPSGYACSEGNVSGGLHPPMLQRTLKKQKILVYRLHKDLS